MTADPVDVRATLLALASERGESLSALSRLIGRNVAYLQQFVHRDTPDRLDEADRLVLAQHFQVDERRLGARDPWTPAPDDSDLSPLFPLSSVAKMGGFY